MGLEIRVGRLDHKVAEVFATEEPRGLDALVFEASNVRFQTVCMEAAAAHGVARLVEPLTERLVEPGYKVDALDYWDTYPVSPSEFRKASRQAEFVERVVGTQPDLVSELVAPHFFADGPETLELNQALAGMTVQAFRSSGKPVRAILSLPRAMFADIDFVRNVAGAYRAIGIHSIDLRLSPLGGEDDGPQKIESALQILEMFRTEGPPTILGYQGEIGHTALALGLVRGYSTGIGFREGFNHSLAMNRQRRSQSQTGFRGVTPGVHLPVADVTVQRALANALYNDPSIQTRLACSLGACARDLHAPTKHPRPHFLHSRTARVGDLLQYPEPWRATAERNRLLGATEFRQKLNEHHIPTYGDSVKTRRIPTRTIASLIAAIDRRSNDAKTA